MRAGLFVVWGAGLTRDRHVRDAPLGARVRVGAATRVWLGQVHAFCLGSGAGLTCAEAAQRFGPPPAGDASHCMQRGLGGGMFIVRPTGVGNQHRYYAVRLPDANGQGGHRAASYFDGLRRVRSVFELGEAVL